MELKSTAKGIFLIKYPFLFEIEENRFTGYFDGKFKLQLTLPAFPQTNRAKCNIFEGLQKVNDFQLPEDVTLDELMNHLTKFLTGRKSEQPTHATLPDASHILDVLAQLERIKGEHSCKIFVDGTLSKLKLTCFKLHEDHHLELACVSDASFAVTSHSLPELGPSVELFKWPASPEAQVGSFIQILNQLDEFYSNLHTLDQLCHVVDPTVIDTRTTWRIIKFSQKVFLKIALHPLQPSSVEVKFIGPTAEIECLRELYNGKLEDWDAESDVYTNLLRTFEIMAFPMRNDNDSAEGTAVDCGICMSHRDANDRIPIVSCDNEKCSLIFHIGCLNQWFHSLEKSKTFFSISIGTCPYCKQKVSSTFDELLRSL